VKTGADEKFVRLVTSFVTTEEQIDQFCELISKYVNE